MKSLERKERKGWVFVEMMRSDGFVSRRGGRDDRFPTVIR
jgi:hypothetical protein